jgi:hypothetical protein
MKGELKMSETTKTNEPFVGYEYKEVLTTRDMEGLYADSYPNFGWKLDGCTPSLIGLSVVNLKFKRDRKIRNKAELTRLQRQFDGFIAEIARMEKSKASSAFIAAFTVGLIGSAFMAGATFAFLGGLILPCIILAIPAFTGWILPYFLYSSAYAKKAAKVGPLIDKKYDEIYEICERANSLLGS